MSKEFDRRVKEFFRTYHERGMKKWSGFFLSDHRVAINADNKDRGQTYAKKSEMTQEEISEVLLKSYSEHYQVSLQLKDLDGTEKGYQDTDLFVDEISDTAEQAIHSLLMEKLNLALKQLSKAERDFILSYYDMEKPNMTVLASQYGVTRQAADKRLKKIQEKIKKLVAIF